MSAVLHIDGRSRPQNVAKVRTACLLAPAWGSRLKGMTRLIARSSRASRLCWQPLAAVSLVLACAAEPATPSSEAPAAPDESNREELPSSMLHEGERND